jgi:GTP-binding protein YchF
MPNVGKSTLFCALSRVQAPVSNYPFCTIDRNQAVVPVPDPRLDRIAGIFDQQQRTPATIEFIDIAGLVQGAHRGEGLGNQFLAHIRECDAIVHVVRCFGRDDVAHVDGSVDPRRDLENVELELLLADLGTVERRLERSRERRKRDPEHFEEEQGVLERLRTALRAGQPARSLELSEHERPVVDELFLLSDKPALVVANAEEADAQVTGPDEAGWCAAAEAWAAEHGWAALRVCAQIEAELAELPEGEAAEMVAALELPAAALDRLITAGYRLLDLITFFTAVGAEARAWTLRRGSTAVDAAGKIHSDMAQGFIKAEVAPYARLDEAGSWGAAREAGAVAIEGRDYVVQDGDVLIIRFSGG